MTQQKSLKYVTNCLFDSAGTGNHWNASTMFVPRAIFVAFSFISPNKRHWMGLLTGDTL